MFPFMSFAVSSICVLLPFIVVIFVIGSYNLATGNLSITGISKQEKDEKKHWSSVLEITRKTGNFLALAISAIGSVLALIGFFSPWVTASISSTTHLGLDRLNGSLTGFGLFIKSILASFEVFGVDMDGTGFVGAFLLLIAFLVFLTFVALLLSALAGLGIIAIPFGYTKREIGKLSRQIVIFAVIAVLFSCTFFAGVQAATNGFEISSSSDLFDFGLTANVQFAKGFWYTFLGLLFTIFGALVSNKPLDKYVSWIETVSKLEQE